MAVLDAFNEALERRDLDATLALFVRHPDVTLVGSEEGETATGPSELHSFFERIFGGEWEVILADNGSRYGTVAVAQRWAERLPLRIVSVGGPPDAGRARNAGAAAARADLLAFCDGDDEVSPGWRGALLEALRDAPLVTGPIDCRRLNSARAAKALDGVMPSGPEWLPRVTAGGNVAVRRAVLEAVGGFPEDYGRGEDTAFGWSVQLAGYPLAVAPAALVYYRLKGDSRRAMFQRFYRYGRASVKHYRSFRERGMPRSPARDVVYDWATIPLNFLRGRSYFAAQMAGCRVGRLVGSARSRILYL